MEDQKSDFNKNSKWLTPLSQLSEFIPHIPLNTTSYNDNGDMLICTFSTDNKNTTTVINKKTKELIFEGVTKKGCFSPDGKAYIENKKYFLIKD